ncbi:Sec-independent protein translocase protein TatB [Sphingomonas sp. CD22]|uniref:Sec-independent protein translocase protein TatB n=1 Tax=Sphingomonas sp. CD22 TaxID=3100214 RepID=UPI002AE03FC3|nr:Sec-independent protein translocase protein TatB [Sphingomonas sp. CD22]MEA1084169.1 Sec-independent protein translocase protein TatB [Sphingomonas sp. CD22]
MFGVDSSEFLLIAVVALVVIGPRDLPKAMRVVGYWVGKARGVSRSFRQGFDNMVREAELEEMEKRWAAENARIMAEHPASSDAESQAAAEPVAPAPLDADRPPHDADVPVMVEKPVVTAAPEHAPAPRPDSTPS